MDLSSSIANMSINMHQASLQTNIATGVLKKSMDTSTELAKGVINMMSQSAPAFAGDPGAIFDARA